MKSILLITLFFSVIVFSQTQKDDSEIKYSIKNLDWLAGYWSAEINSTKMEEFWLPVTNGSMIGIHRDSFQSGKVFFEYLRIAQTDESFSYYASPMGKKSTEFKLKSLNEKNVVFENPEHDFPQRIIYSLKTDTLIARIEGNVNGNFKYSEWQWVNRNYRNEFDCCCTLKYFNLLLL